MWGSKQAACKDHHPTKTLTISSSTKPDTSKGCQLPQAHSERLRTFILFVYFYLLRILGIDPRVSCMLSKHFTTELGPHSPVSLLPLKPDPRASFFPGFLPPPVTPKSEGLGSNPIFSASLCVCRGGAKRVLLNFPTCEWISPIPISGIFMSVKLLQGNDEFVPGQHSK